MNKTHLFSFQILISSKGFRDSLEGLLNSPGDSHPAVGYQQEEKKQEGYNVVNSNGKVHGGKDSFSTKSLLSLLPKIK